VAKFWTFRLYLLRLGYVVLALGLALMIWSGILFPGENVPHMNAVVRSMLGAVSLLAIVGIFYPLKMLPLMLFELLWKSIWLLAFGLRAWLAGALSADAAETFGDCIFGVIFVLVVIPWDYLFKRYWKMSENMLAPTSGMNKI
jgi:hypothetical protein